MSKKHLEAIGMLGIQFVCFIKNTEYRELALELGVSKQTVSDWAKQRSSVKEKYSTRLEEILGVSKEILFKELTKEDMILVIENHMN
jgi:transcriptional regulator with XRE-family HTH domain